MTTTLRPSGPEVRTADGGRARAYDVCVNGRPVGRLRLAAGEDDGGGVGRIEALHIDPAARRRGRATVAALAAEEVLRDWRCRRIEVRVPAEAEWALRLARALGYVESHRAMTKQVTTAPALPEGSEDHPMGAEEFGSWLGGVTARYAAHWAERGLPRARAEEKARTDLRRLLPNGAATGGAVLRVLRHRGTPVGTLWLALRPSGPERPGPWVLHLEVAAPHRGRGHGRTLLGVAERECLAAGHRTLGLTAWSGEPPTEPFYRRLGYRTRTHVLTKPLL